MSASRSESPTRVAELDGLLAAIDKGRWSFEMLLHHRGNDVATLAWAKTFLKEGFDIFRLTALSPFPPTPEQENEQ